MSVLADALLELPCPICEFLFLKRVRKSRELNFIVLSLKYVHCRFVHGFFTSSFTTKYGLDLINVVLK